MTTAPLCLHSMTLLHRLGLGAQAGCLRIEKLDDIPRRDGARVAVTPVGEDARLDRHLGPTGMLEKAADVRSHELVHERRHGVGVAGGFDREAGCG